MAMEIVTPENLTAPAANPATPAKANRLQLITSVVAFVLLALSLAWGVLSGIANAKSRETYASVGNLYQAVQYFYADQGSYPSVDQVMNQQVLTLDYLSAQPVPVDVSGKCAAYPEFEYVRNSSQSFSLSFCLLQGVGGYPAGLNSIDGTPPAKGAQ
jgi:hypothetical protein